MASRSIVVFSFQFIYLSEMEYFFHLAKYQILFLLSNINLDLKCKYEQRANLSSVSLKKLNGTGANKHAW